MNDQVPPVTSATPVAAPERLVKFVAHAGICSRRKAEFLIKDGQITVNGDVITDPAVFVKPADVVRYQEQRLKPEQFFYLALNKPRNVVCTASDPNGQTTVFDVIKSRKLPKVRLYHVGRLDQTSTGLLIITNDGDFCQRIAHPSCKIMKTYKVTLHKDLTPEAIEIIKRGVKLEDGFARADSVVPVRSRVANTFRVSLHSGKNRIIRRMFACISYYVESLERVSFGPISVKGLATGEWRFLKEDEVAQLREASMVNSGEKPPRQERSRGRLGSVARMSKIPVDKKPVQ